MNIFGVSRKRKLDQLESDLEVEVARAQAVEGQLTTDLTNEVARAQAAEGQLTTDLTNEVARAQAAEGQLTTDLGNLDTDLNTLKYEVTYNPKAGSSISTAYPVEWSNNKSSGFGYNNSGEFYKTTPSTDLDYIYSKPGMFDFAQYDYDVRLTLTSSIGEQMTLGFVSSQQDPATSRVGSSYPQTTGPPSSYPLVGTNCFGENVHFFVGRYIRNIATNSQNVQHTNSVSTEAASTSSPWYITWKIRASVVTEMLCERPGFTAEFNHFTANFSPPVQFPLAHGTAGKMSLCVLDANNYEPSGFAGKVEILNRSIRTDPEAPFILSNLHVPKSITFLPTAEDRFISDMIEVVRLPGYAQLNHLQANHYFLPSPRYIGQRLVIFNESSTNLTLWQPDQQTSFTLSSSSNRDHYEFIAVDLLSWHQII